LDSDIDFKVISTTENSNKFQKPRFWKEKSVEGVITLGNGTAPLVKCETMPKLTIF
jgi:hypothetical protein